METLFCGCGRLIIEWVADWQRMSAPTLSIPNLYSLLKTVAPTVTPNQVCLRRLKTTREEEEGKLSSNRAGLTQVSIATLRVSSHLLCLQTLPWLHTETNCTTGIARRSLSICGAITIGIVHIMWLITRSWRPPGPRCSPIVPPSPFDRRPASDSLPTTWASARAITFSVEHSWLPLDTGFYDDGYDSAGASFILDWLGQITEFLFFSLLPLF